LLALAQVALFDGPSSSVYSQRRNATSKMLRTRSHEARCCSAFTAMSRTIASGSATGRRAAANAMSNGISARASIASNSSALLAKWW